MIPNQQIFPGFFLWVFLKLSSLFIFPGVFQVHIFHFRSHNTSPRKLVVSPRPYKLSEFDLSDRQLALTVWKPMGTNLQAVQEFGPHWLQKKHKKPMRFLISRCKLYLRSYHQVSSKDHWENDCNSEVWRPVWKKNVELKKIHETSQLT